MKRFLVHILSLVLGVSVGTMLHAQTAESYDSKIDGPSFRVDSSCRTVDSIFNTVNYSSQITGTYLVRNSIILEIVDNGTVVFPDSFSIDVSVAIDWTDSTHTVNHDFKTLHVEYNNRNLIEDTLRSFYPFMGGHIVTVKITGIVAHNISTPLPDIIRLVNRMDLYRDYFALCGGSGIVSVDTSYIPDQDELLVSWVDFSTWANSVGLTVLFSSADEFDLEWTFYDDSSEVFKLYDSLGVIPNPDDVFRNNCSRVSIKNSSYQIPLIYEKGILIYRVRSVRIVQGGVRILSEWTDINAGRSIYPVRGHEERLNWQSKTSFAEGGKRKSVVNYFDGSSHSRQIVTKINTDTTAIVAETMYDWEGRPVINTLPAPTIQKLIKHFDLFNKDMQDSSYTWRDLDSNATGCNNPPKVMNTNSGSSQYYSAANPNVNTGFNQYIPDAFGYPFSQTAYTHDLTNRIRLSSGPGKDHKMGTQHVTSYIYGAPDQSDLTRLFGSEAGNKDHYFKNLVIDPNGQESVTYQDMHGRTIATALAGYPSPLDSVRLDTIPDYRGDTVLYDAIIDTTNNLIDGTSIICTKTFIAATAGNYDCYYSLFPENLTINTCDSSHFCMDCVYDLKITVTDDCNNKKMPGLVPFVLVDSNYSFSGILPYYFDTLCSNKPIIDSFRLVLPIGEYTVTKILSIKKEAIDFYFDTYIRKDTCLKKFDDFYQDALSDINFDGCEVTCTECLQHLGTLDTFSANFLANIIKGDSTRVLTATDTFNASFAYQELKHACDMLCDSFNICEQRRAFMLSDMSPTGGQYAQYNLDSLDDIFTYTDSTSILADSISIYSHHPLYSDSSIVYRNSNNEPDTIIADFNHDGVLDTLLPNSLTPVQFIQYWKPSWAEALLQYHPEYCYYQFCVANNASNAFDEWLISISSYDTANLYGLMNPLNMPPDSVPYPPNASHQDPFFATGGLGYQYSDEFKERLMRYSLAGGTATSVWDLAKIMMACADPTCTNCMKNYYWNAFRNMYLGAKRIEEDSIMLLWVNATSPVNCSTHTPPLFGPNGTAHYTNKTPRFDIINSTSSPVPLSLDTGTAMHIADSMSTQGQNFTCRDYAAYWWQQLSGCGIPISDSVLIINELIAVCDSGVDSGHPMGASSTRPNTSSPNGNKTFEDVLNWASGANGWSYHESDSCTALLITNPIPNSASPMYYQNAQIDRPSECVCERISNARKAYLLDSGYTSFSQYLTVNRGIFISEEDIQILLKSCDTTNPCPKLDHPVSLPYQFDCSILCANCYQIITAYNNFLQRFPGIYNSPHYFALMQSSMNSELGMNLTVNEYFGFLSDSCHYNNFPYNDSVPCKAPIAINDTVYIGYAQAQNINVTGNDQANGAVTVDILRHATSGTDAVSGNSIYYSPFSGYTSDRIDEVKYIICNECNTISCDSATLLIHVSASVPRYSPPVANRDTFMVCIDSLMTFDPIANDNSTDGGSVHLSTMMFIADPSVGSVVQSGDNLICNINTPGNYTVSYTVCNSDPHPLCTVGSALLAAKNCTPPAMRANINARTPAKKTEHLIPVAKEDKPISTQKTLPYDTAKSAHNDTNRVNSFAMLQHLSTLKTDATSGGYHLSDHVIRFNTNLTNKSKNYFKTVSFGVRLQKNKGADTNLISRLSSNKRAGQMPGKVSTPHKAIKDLPYAKMFRNIRLASALIKSTTFSSTFEGYGESPSISKKFDKKTTSAYAQGGYLAANSNNVMKQVTLNNYLSPKNNPQNSSPSGTGQREGFMAFLVPPTGYNDSCDTLTAIYNRYISIYGNNHEDQILSYFNNIYGTEHKILNVGYVDNTLSYWLSRLDSCGLSCHSLINCDTLTWALNRFDSIYPTGRDTASVDLFTSFLNSTLLQSQGADYASWSAMYSCCGISIPVPDSTMNHCDSVMQAGVFLGSLNLPDHCLPGYAWDFLLQEEYPDLGYTSIYQLSNAIAGCGHLPPFHICDTMLTHCDSVRSLVPFYDFIKNFDGRDGSQIYDITAGMYGYLFGTSKTTAEVMREIAACDSSQCLVSAYGLSYLDSVGQRRDTCIPPLIFTAVMNGVSGYQYSAAQWCAKIQACGGTCPALCADTIFTTCDSVNAAIKYYATILGDQGDDIQPDILSIAFTEYYGRAISPGDAMTMYYICAGHHICDDLGGLNTDILGPIFSAYHPCVPEAVLTSIFGAYTESGSLFSASNICTLISYCGDSCYHVCASPGTHCDSIAMVVTAWGHIKAAVPDVDVQTLEQIGQAILGINGPPYNSTQWCAMLSACGDSFPMVCNDTVNAFCDSVHGALSYYYTSTGHTSDDDVDPAALATAFSTYYGRSMTQGDAMARYLICTDSTFCEDFNGLNNDVLKPIFDLYSPCVPAAVITGIFGAYSETGGILSADNVCVLYSHCGLSCYNICPADSMTHCDSISMVATAWAHIVAANPSIDIISLEQLGHAILHADGPQYTSAQWCAMLSACGDSFPIICADTALTQCDSVSRAMAVYQIMMAGRPDGGDDIVLDSLAVAFSAYYGRTMSAGDALLLYYICNGESFCHDESGLNADILGPIFNSYYPCVPEPVAVGVFNAFTNPDGVVFSADNLCGFLAHCGDTCYHICPTGPTTSCDSMAMVITMWRNIQSVMPDIDQASLENIAQLVLRRDDLSYDSIIALGEPCMNICYIFRGTDAIRIITDSVIGVLPQLLTGDTCVPRAVLEAVYSHFAHVPLIYAEFQLTCGKNLVFDTCVGTDMSRCDSLKALNETYTETHNFNSIKEFLVGLGFPPTVTVLMFDSALNLCDTAHVMPCAHIDTIKAQINQFLVRYPGIQYASDFQSKLYQYLDNKLLTYMAPYIQPHPLRPGDIDWCAILTACGDSCPKAIQGPELCNRPLLPPVSAQYTDSCNMQQEQYAFANATAAYGAYMEGLKDSIENLYVSKCLGAYRLDSFSYMHPNAEYHFTLYYYDQAGNLVKTIPPAGVDLYHQHHTMATRYRYNTLNQVVEQMTPDAGRSLMWYDRIGKVTFSQNARQKPNGQYSYTLYDPLQRIIEVGQWGGADTIDRYGAVDTVALGDWYGFLQTFGTQLTEVTHTYYDYDTLHIHDTLGVAENMYLRNRVASTTYADVLDRSNIHNYQAASHYLYDIHGNVSTLLQENTSLRRIGQQWKKINYDYDLVSGKVNEVIYQPGKPDMFIHAYDYDADNRLTDVRTTRDSVIWDHDASYSYYKHGPLARMELGDAKVQAMNYAYTIQGWLKGVNGLDPEHNIGRDGESSGINSIVAKSEMGYALTYYKGDYQPISRIFATNLRPVEGDYTNLDIRSLYNGNIALMQLNLPKVGLAQAYRYSYDQLNRITGMTAYTGLTQPGNNPLGFHTATWSSSTALSDYAEKVNYDPNGNIAFYNRHGNSGTNVDMDSMLYRYLPGTNKLDHVDDAVAAANYSVDIDDQDTLNYRYDQIGNLTRDTSEGIDSIKWNLYGTIQEIDKHNGDTIRFAYDPAGHRIMKEVYKDSTHHKKGAYYVHDATGNIMATYDWQDRDTFKLSDLMMYGSSRLGSIDVGLLMCDTINNDSVTNASRALTGSSLTNGVVYHTYGIKQYELSNHLGNVLATITDRHISVYAPTLQYYLADVASAQDYYPFGMQMPGRIFSGEYKFGFNGQEKDDEIEGKGNLNTAMFWEYDTRLGRRWNVDPVIKPWESSYATFSNNPIYFNDPDGDDAQEGGGDGKSTDGKSTGGKGQGYSKGDGHYSVTGPAPPHPLANRSNKSGETKTSTAPMPDFKIKPDTRWGDYYLDRLFPTGWTVAEQVAARASLFIAFMFKPVQMGKQDVPVYMSFLPDEEEAEYWTLNGKKARGEELTPSEQARYQELDSKKFGGIPKIQAQNEEPQLTVTSINQLQKLVESKQAPATIDRFDKGITLAEKDHVHFTDGNALNKDGTWKHGGRILSNKEIKFLKSHGWELPKQ